MRSGSTTAKREVSVWGLGAVYAGTQIAQFLSGNAIPNLAFNAAITLSSFGAAIVHGSIRYGWRGIGVFALLTIAISNALENLSIVTGFPFGWYHYSPALGAQLLHVPLVIGPAYFSVGYLAWAVANAILWDADRGHGRFDWIMLPVLAAFIMVGWDLAMDPLRSTVACYWVWPNGGGFFGVPVSNFLGWYLTVFVVFVAFARSLSRCPSRVSEGQDAAYWHQASILFLLCILPFAFSYAAGSDEIVQDARGISWRVADIQESAVLVAIFTMVFAGAAAIFSVMRRYSA